jgi:hypothetical protein
MENQDITKELSSIWKQGTPRQIKTSNVKRNLRKMKAIQDFKLVNVSPERKDEGNIWKQFMTSHYFKGKPKIKNILGHQVRKCLEHKMIERRGNLGHQMMKRKTKTTRPFRISSSRNCQEHKESSRPLGNTPKELKGNSWTIWNHVKITLEIKESISWILSHL